MSTLSILQMNWKKVIPPGLSLILSDLALTVLLNTLRNATAFRLLTLKTQRWTLCMTLVASCWAVNVSMVNSQEMRGMRLATECDYRRPYMANTTWLKPSFFRHTVSDAGWSFGRKLGMWYLPKWNFQGIMLKVDNGFESAVESCRLQVRATTPDFVEWVGDIVGRVWQLVEHSSVGESKFIRVKLGGHLRKVQLLW